MSFKWKIIRWAITSDEDPRWGSSGKQRGILTMMTSGATKHLSRCDELFRKWPKDLMYKAWQTSDLGTIDNKRKIICQTKSHKKL